ncbi:hypothetical protein [Gallaecimonas mangrovi]|uniref:hypothetical protein n=1 Tax=Gallaecimonas mangrovi TaxID=2291597 RepID=UPI000E1FCB3C|nr:hypothetical protein [Gallaecimonas mangrovi]
MKNILFLFLILLSLSGCTAPVHPAKLDVPKTNTQLEVKDLRPKDQGKTEFLSYIVTNCDYGIKRFGDEWSTPDKVTYLKSAMANAFPEAKVLEVKNLVFYENMQYALRNGNIFRGPAWAFVECDKSTDKFTQYTQKEDPTRAPIMIGTLEGSLDGKPFSERMTMLPACTDNKKECNFLDAQGETIKTLLEGMTKKAIDSIR